jgi:2,3-bisphosphoglycerate-independent phosphoglycerate mutase
MPKMSADKITDAIVDNLKKENYDFYALNFANADMVGHTGNMSATIKGVEWVDKKLMQIYNEVSKGGGNLIITADHGNADNMIDVLDGKDVINTFHTKNKVPFIILGKDFQGKNLISGGKLANIAPTILDIMEVEKPKEMACESLLN